MIESNNELNNSKVYLRNNNKLFKKKLCSKVSWLFFIIGKDKRPGDSVESFCPKTAEDKNKYKTSDETGSNVDLSGNAKSILENCLASQKKKIDSKHKKLEENKLEDQRDITGK